MDAKYELAQELSPSAIRVSPKGRSATVYDALYWNLWSVLRLMWGWNECGKERNECGGRSKERDELGIG